MLNVFGNNLLTQKECCAHMIVTVILSRTSHAAAIG